MKITGPVQRAPRPAELRARPRARRPRPRLRSCCEYHGQDWSFASETAIGLLAAAQGEGLAGQTADRVTELAEAEGTQRERHRRHPLPHQHP